MARFLKVHEVCVQIHMDESTARQLAAEGLVEIRRPTSGVDEVVTADDAERLRVIAVLMNEMDVNLAGVEVILHMREELLSMRRQFDEVVATLVEEMKKEVGGGSGS